MKRIQTVLLLILYFTFARGSSSTHCFPDNSCCGDLLVGAFSVGIHETLAQNLGYFTAEGITVCFEKITQSTTLYDNYLANNLIDIAGSQVDNAVWRKLNNSINLSVLSGTDGQRGFWLVGNTKVLNGNNYVSALSGTNIVVDSPDSGYVVGLKKVLKDYGVTNVSYIPYGTNRLGVVQAGVLSGVPIAATMQNNIAPYLYTYPVVTLAVQTEHLCPSQGSSYIANSAWITNPTNRALATKFFRALLRAYIYELDPANRAAVNSFIASNAGVSDNGTIELQYDDYFKNPAAGLNPYLIPRKAGLRNIINARIDMGLSPYPTGGIDSFLSSTPGGFVDLGPLLDAQSSLNLPSSVNNYDTDTGLAGCPTGNKGVVVTAAPQLLCNATYTISSQPPSWPTGLSATLSVTVANPASLTINGQPGWNIQFTAKGAGSTPPFQITSSYNNGGITSTTNANGYVTFTVANANYNTQTPQNIGWNGATTLASPYNNICDISINGYPCNAFGAASTSC